MNDANFYIFITKKCNFSCPYCLDRNRKDKVFKIQSLKNLPLKEYKRVTITGGEPLMVKPKLYLTLLYLKFIRGIKTVYLHTNLSKLSKFDALILPFFIDNFIVSLPSLFYKDYESIAKKDLLLPVLAKITRLTKIMSFWKKKNIIINLVSTKKSLGSLNTYVSFLNNLYNINKRVSLSICMLSEVSPKFFDEWYYTNEEFELLKVKLAECNCKVRFIKYPKCMVSNFLITAPQTSKALRGELYQVVGTERNESAADLPAGFDKNKIKSNSFYFLQECKSCNKYPDCPGFLGNLIKTRDVSNYVNSL